MNAKLDVIDANYSLMRACARACVRAHIKGHNLRSTLHLLLPYPADPALVLCTALLHSQEAQAQAAQQQAST